MPTIRKTMKTINMRAKKNIYIYMHMSTFIRKLMDVLIIYLISTFVQGFVFKTYTHICTQSIIFYLHSSLTAHPCY